MKEKKKPLPESYHFYRKDPEYKKWRDNVFKRDDYTCQFCGRKGSHLEAHHKNNYASFPLERCKLNNGVTFCFDCHDRFHEEYGRTNNTKEQFDEYIKNRKHRNFKDIPKLF